ncbi:MAG: type II toxin-antitoxin system RelE/ParE family toxin [Candidatus Omnitrophota bacterium]
MYQVELSRIAAKELERIYNSDRKIYFRIISVLESLSDDPFQGKALKNVLKGFYSYRVGVYRIIYAVEQKELLISIIDIGHRRDIYR